MAGNRKRLDEYDRHRLYFDNGGIKISPSGKVARVEMVKQRKEIAADETIAIKNDSDLMISLFRTLADMRGPIMSIDTNISTNPMLSIACGTYTSPGIRTELNKYAPCKNSNDQSYLKKLLDNDLPKFAMMQNKMQVYSAFQQDETYQRLLSFLKNSEYCRSIYAIMNLHGLQLDYNTDGNFIIKETANTNTANIISLVKENCLAFFKNYERYLMLTGIENNFKHPYNSNNLNTNPFEEKITDIKTKLLENAKINFANIWELHEEYLRPLHTDDTTTRNTNKPF